MPKISNPSSNDICFLCGCQAYYISFNAKNLRCVEKITQCVGFVKKAKTTKFNNTTQEQRSAHAKLMSKNGNSKLKKLHEDPLWRKNKSNNISEGRVKHGTAMNPIFKDKWAIYENSVDRITRGSWIYYQDIINPNKLLRGNDYELDHKYSKWQGFMDNIPPEIIGHYSNLCLIKKIENRQKRNKCSISKEELYSGVNSIKAPLILSSETSIRISTP
jgi:hypothetical protein